MAIDITISHYSDGTATVAGVNVTGQGTAWSKLRKGDLYGTHLGFAVRIAEVIDDTHLTLAHDVPALYQIEAAYEIQRTPYDLGYLQGIQDLLEKLGNGNLESFAGLAGLADRLPMFTGPGELSLVSKIDLSAGLKSDGQSPDQAGLAAFEDENAGFIVRVADYLGGRAALVEKLNNGAPAVWSAPSYITGPAITLDITEVDDVPYGEPPDVTLTPREGGYDLAFAIPRGMLIEPGTTTTLPPGSDAVVNFVPVTGGYRLDISLPKGDTGDIDGVTPFWVSRLSTDVDAEDALTGLGVTPFWQSRILNDADVTTAQMGLGVPTMGFIGGVLTLASGIAVPESDVIGATTIYLTPALTSFTALWSGTAWRAYEFAEISLALPTSLVAGGNYDVWEFDNGSGALTIGVGPSWFSGAINGGNNARGQGAGSSELEVFQGRLVNKNSIELINGAFTRTVPARQARLRGTIRMTANGVTEDSKLKRFVSNVHNAPLRHLVKTDTTDTWDYSLAVWRQARAAADNQVEYVQTVAGRLVEAQVMGITYNATGSVNAIQGSVGIGIDSTSVESSQRRSGAVTFNRFTPCEAYYKGYPGIGYHRLVWLELGGAHATDVNRWVGDMGAIGPNAFQTGISAEMVV